MNRKTTSIAGLFIIFSRALSADAIPQSPIVFATSPVSPSSLQIAWTAEWQGIENRTSFTQWSFDLVTWSYLPSVDFGTGIKTQGGTNPDAKYFMRLVNADDTTAKTLQQARDADFDNDGIPNSYEVETLGSDPLDKSSAGGDTNNNGLADGWEKFCFGDLTTAVPSASLKPDGLTNKEKADLGLNPNVDYSTTTAPQPYTYLYDLVGRLTTVAAPVAAGTYTPDPEGNINTAQ